jgi:group II intron reverse transcriptase/maturase
VVLVLEPIFEVDLQPEQYAYRPGRNAHDAIRHVDTLLRSGHTQVVDADLSGYFDFDSIPHAELMKCLRRRIADGTMLHLLKMWLETPVEETDDRGRTQRTTTNKDSGRGTPQGAPISPLLANLYMRRFVLGWKAHGHDQRLDAHIVNYADDFVICCNGTAEQAMPLMRNMMEKLKLTVNDAKTHVCHLPDEAFDFLGFTFGRYYSPRTGRASINRWPSRKRVSRFCAEISEQTDRRFLLLDVADRVARLNRMLVGWRNYFAIGAYWKAFHAVERHTQRRLRRWLCRKHKVQGSGGRTYPLAYLYDVLGLVSLERTAPRYGAARAKP